MARRGSGKTITLSFLVTVDRQRQTSFKTHKDGDSQTTQDKAVIHVTHGADDKSKERLIFLKR